MTKAKLKSLGTDALYQSCDPGQFEFETTAELEPLAISASRYLLFSNSQFFIDQRALQALPDLGEDPVRAAHRLPGTAAGGLSSRSHFRGGEHNETAMFNITEVVREQTVRGN